MSLLKLKINVNLPQLLRIVVSAAQKRNLSDLRGFALTVTARYKEIRVESASARRLNECDFSFESS